jgi:hypothetical protein
VSHEIPKHLADLYQLIEMTEDPTARLNHLMDLASKFAANHDLLDHEMIEEIHELVEVYERSRLDYRQTAVRLGRLAMTIIQSAIDEGDTLAPNPEAN